MCGVCGCSEPNHEHRHEHHHDHSHHAHHNDHDHNEEQTRLITIEQDILAKNDRYAAKNRRYFSEQGILALNLVSSPGAGKTTLLCETIRRLDGEIESVVIEGDQQTNLDADRIRATGARAVQINTGKGCHLDGHMVGHAIQELNPQSRSLLFIENVGNLVCPAAFDLGESFRVVILSVTEGDDKPLKYPDMFHGADLMLINKTDLLPYVDFDIERCIEYARRINPGIRIVQLSSTSGSGFDAWLDWLRAASNMAQTGCQNTADTQATA